MRPDGGKETRLVNAFRIYLDIYSVFLYDAPILLVDPPISDFDNTYICSGMRIPFYTIKDTSGMEKGLVFSCTSV